MSIFDPRQRINAIDFYKFSQWMIDNHMEQILDDLIAGRVNIPTVLATPVVKCKECKFYKGHLELCDNQLIANDNGFCPMGEEK